MLSECSSSTLPQQVDLRPNLEKWGLGPRLQHKRGTCSVFAVAQALEYAMAAKSGKGVRLSVEYLLWAGNRAFGLDWDGAYFTVVYLGYDLYGICEEADWPYGDSFDPKFSPPQTLRDKAKALHDPEIRFHWIKHWNPRTGLTPEQLTEIKQVLNQNWPVCGGLRWPKKAEYWPNDAINMMPDEQVQDGHSVMFVGYEDDAQYEGGGRLIFRNTQNEGRFGTMSYAYACTYLNDALWVAYEPGSGTITSPTKTPTVNELLNPLGFFSYGRNRRVSSNEQPAWNDANMDMTWLMPGESVNMPVFEGPGVITHMWFTSHAGMAGELNALSMRIYYDGDEEPGVEVPLGDFFAVGDKPAEVNSIPVQVSPTGSLTCYWRIPFRKSARIVITNDNPDRSTGLYWIVDWLQLPALPKETPYFYARYRREYPAVSGRDYMLADLKGRGFYVGTILGVTLAQDGWFGEGDDFFYIDGEPIPSLQGTGSEDYFNDAWGFRPRTSVWFGQPRWGEYAPGDEGICYRWHIPDAVRFSRSLKVTIEHKGNTNDATAGYFLERPDFFSSIAIWYQFDKPEHTFEPMPDWCRRRVPWERHHFVKAYLQAKTSDKSEVSVQMHGGFGARPMLAWTKHKPDAVLTLPLHVSEDGRYAVCLFAAKGPDYGAYDVELDNKKAATANFHAPEMDTIMVNLGVHELSKGDHTVIFHASSDTVKPDKALALEELRLLKLPAPAKREEKTHHEAHFIRLPIGSAIYAYRLAFGVLPDSLEMLVEKGFLAERYLRDENNLPLKCTRKEDCLEVESPGRDKWTHSWKGLDARR
ncbi:MAG: DUF2961 domain-containing protein [Sedimentisphaerales bacterium]|nr:DUF2961 domain-containing protein [Sedimentisphaerales bacterium]